MEQIGPVENGGFFEISRKVCTLTTKNLLHEISVLFDLVPEIFKQWFTFRKFKIQLFFGFSERIVRKFPGPVRFFRFRIFGIYRGIDRPVSESRLSSLFYVIEVLVTARAIT